ncbi:MAG TPA: hypothetical protein VMY34_02650 [Acidimicrobiales bacterium]|nr:hypothetical protein [Acidimicrobiales bacterium]
MIFGQGTTDNLFNLNQGLKNFDNALTPAARAKSIFVGYNGGHVLPSAFPLGTGVSGDPCSNLLNGTSFGALAQRFLTENLKGVSTGLTGHGLYHLTTAAGQCVTVDSVAADTSIAVGTIATTVEAGAPQHVKLADGPISVAGTPFVDTVVSTSSTDARLFFSLAIGITPADARIIQNNMMPLRVLGPTVDGVRTVELPAIAVDVPAGQSLFLTVSPVSDMSIGYVSRVPGAVLLEDTVVRIPQV